MIPSGMECLFEELLGALDEEIRVLELKCSHLTGLFQALVDRDQEATEAILEQMEQSQEVQISVDLRLGAIRRTLADALGCKVQELKLSKLVAVLPSEWARETDDRRRRIIDLTAKLRREHLQTAMLLNECIRINRTLLASLLPSGDPVVTYNTEGTDIWRPETGLMDTES